MFVSLERIAIKHGLEELGSLLQSFCTMTAEYTGTYMLPLKGLRPEASAQYVHFLWFSCRKRRDPICSSGQAGTGEEVPLGVLELKVSLGVVDAQRGCTGQPNSIP